MRTKKSFLFTCLDHEKGLSYIIDSYLDWQSIFSLKYTGKALNQLFRHPYIRHVKNKFSIRDGSVLNDEECHQFLKNTRTKYGTELVECAIFERYHQICIDEPIKIADSLHILDFFQEDESIDTALQLSKWSLYYLSLDLVTRNRLDKIVQEKDLITSSDYSFRNIASDPLYLIKDSQLEYIFIKTELPIFYRYIFARRLLHYRDRCRVLYDSFGLEV